jgi:hypothetical protein
MIPAAALLAAALSPSFTARRLLAADFGVPRREAEVSGLPYAVDERGGASPEIVFDATRLRALPPGEAEAEYARALALAAIAAPVPLVEAEQAGRQWTAAALVEAAAEDPKLSNDLRAAELRPFPRRPSWAAPPPSSTASSARRTRPTASSRRGRPPRPRA